MSSFSLLQNACQNKQYCGFKDLPFGDYIVTNFTLVETKAYGTGLRVDFGEKYLFLPKRFADSMTPEKLIELNQAPIWMSYIGRDPSRNNK